MSPQVKRALGLALILTVQLMLILDMAVVNVALPDIRGDLGFTPSALSWVLNGYTLTFGGLLLLGSRLGDVFGRRRTFMAGLAVFTTASLLGGLAPTAELLVAARALQGVGAAIAAPSVLALLTTSAPDAAARNKALALFSAVSSAGASIGLLLGGVLTGYASWRWSLLINVPLGIVVLLTVRRLVAETERQRARFDVAGCGHGDARLGEPGVRRSSTRLTTAGPPAARSPRSLSRSCCSARSPSTSGVPLHRCSPPSCSAAGCASERSP